MEENQKKERTVINDKPADYWILKEGEEEEGEGEKGDHVAEKMRNRTMEVVDPWTVTIFISTCVVRFSAKKKGEMAMRGKVQVREWSAAKRKQK